jgi:hypothetical protein
MLRAIKGGLLLGEPTSYPKIEKRMVFAVIPVARRNQLLVKVAGHNRSFMIFVSGFDEYSML